MKQIICYKDYRKYLQDFYDEKKLTVGFSWREFSSLAGFSSPVYMKLVCEGKSALSKSKMSRVAEALGLEGYEKKYFEQMVIFGNAKLDNEKKDALKKMNQISGEHKIRIVRDEAFEYYSSWENPVLRELAPLMPGASCKELANTCCEEVSPEEVQRVLKFLTKTGFLVKTNERTFEQAEKMVVGSKESLPIAIRTMHKEMAEIAVQAVEKYNSNERFFMGATFGLDEDTYRKVTKEIEKCSKRISSLAEKCENMNRVYRLNFQFFPMTKKVTKNGNDEQ